MRKEKWVLAIVTIIMVFGSMTGLCVLMEQIQGETIVESVKEEKQPEEKEGIAQKPFQVLVSGMDTFGAKKLGRSDLNLLLTVNPNSKTVLITNIPRDTYLKAPDLSDADFDGLTGLTEEEIRLTKESFEACEGTKLSHLSPLGLPTLVKGVEGLLDTKVDYYVQINFPGFSTLIDAIGGVDVKTEEGFETDWGTSFKKGVNHVNGKEALLFVRERHHLNRGWYDNQVEMMRSILNKLMKQSVLEMDAEALYQLYKKNVKTDMGTGEILSLIRMQVSDRADWDIKSAILKGNGRLKELGGWIDSSTGESPRFYVQVPKKDSKEKVKNMIQSVMELDQ